MSEAKLTELCERLGYHFKEILLLERALKHRSAGRKHNERLEFLGDSVLSLIVSSELFSQHETAKEGDLSRLRSFLVNGQRLAELGLELGLQHYVKLGEGERKAGGALRASILADTVEAVIGAMYLDGGLEVARTCVLAWYGEKVLEFESLKPEKDAKSQLQEYLQAQALPLPQYQMTTSGKPHELTFKVVCRVKGLPHETVGEGNSRRNAEQVAAANYLELINENRK